MHANYRFPPSLAADLYNYTEFPQTAQMFNNVTYLIWKSWMVCANCQLFKNQLNLIKIWQIREKKNFLRFCTLQTKSYFAIMMLHRKGQFVIQLYLSFSFSWVFGIFYPHNQGCVRWLSKHLQNKFRKRLCIRISTNVFGFRCNQIRKKKSKSTVYIEIGYRFMFGFGSTFIQKIRFWFTGF